MHHMLFAVSLSTSCFLFAGCETKIENPPAENKTTVVNPPAEKTVEKTTVVNPPAVKVEKTTEKTTP